MLVLFLLSSIPFISEEQLNYFHFYYTYLCHPIINYEKN